ncbi:acetyltransferase [Paucilactobacillus hokkaidonensis JCM 18461]|uniref:Acetyltransferase n=2 Tax=Paucilactobacillus hokkaidonensis TaxID=1193095 RepID=A0A0A1GVB3_9LACO|nr:GNAT family N-acetyltransferase [Paucilactobacillus hokkaidonensis]KRO08233.1 acetyltransferase [Paucilactobacillus hokkaidonensis]BAP86162.1 acetyltransferase [Paucilactobacillus hokkaidonensis JCM 18461]
MDDEISLEIAEPDDAAKVLSLLRLLRVETEMFSVSADFERLTVDQEKHNLAQINDTTDNLVLLAWYHAEPIGIATVAKTTADISAGEVGIAIEKKYWHQGVGTFMMDEILNWGVNFSSLKKLVLTVVSENKNAIKLYQKMGFTTIKTIKVKNDHDKILPALLMEYKI